MAEPHGKRLHKSHDRILFGVCGGIAESLGIDPTLIRVLYVVGSILSTAFPGIIVYVILALVMPGPRP